MTRIFFQRVTMGGLITVLLCGDVVAQSFVVDNSVIPPITNIRTEEVALVDVDLDGDLDALFAAGGEDFGVQNRLWINAGGLQGGVLGVFADETAVRLPLVKLPSMDIDAVDIDGDGDLDVHTTNTDFGWSKVSARWWVNVGGIQGGTLGFYVDETAERWVGLAGPGSTVPPSLLTAGGGWTDASQAASFADVDGDGDLDLVHSSYKFAQPPRIFLNDGLGFFSELNPAGTTTSPGGSIGEGSTALWCEGVQQKDTTDASGSFCDILAHADDMDLGDVDGDLDIDIILSDQVAHQQRLHASRLAGSSLAPAAADGTPWFRDVTALSMPTTSSAKFPPRTAELGDLDGDGDLDLYGGNWESPSSTMLWDAIYENDGDGHFASGLIVNTTFVYDVAFLDFDADGDLDVILVDPLGPRLLRNEGELQFALEPQVGGSGGLGVAVGDTDGDGDIDLLFAKYFLGEFQRNVTDVPDWHAPWFPVVETVDDRAAGPGTFPVRFHVLDNQSWMRTRFAETHVELAVDGVVLPESPARWMGGQLFRGEMPANLVAGVSWRVVSTDEQGNTGTSEWFSYTATHGAAFQVSYGSATAGLAGGEPLLRALSAPMAGSALYLAVSSGAPKGTPAIVAVATQALEPGVPVPGLLFLNIAGAPLAVGSGALDANGDHVLTLPLGPLPPGLSAFAQGFVLDPTASGAVFASSRGLKVVTQ